MVMASHMLRGAGRYGIQIARLGFVGVMVFFVLSGYLITRLLIEEEARGGGVNLAAFYSRRVLRIQPPAFIYLAAVAVLARSGCFDMSSRDIWGALLPVRNFFYGSPVTEHFWSLSIEEQFYLLWPLLFVLSRRAHLRIALALVPVVLAPLWHYLASSDHGDVLYRTDHWCDCLLAGCALALARSIGSYAERLVSLSRSSAITLAAIVIVELQFFGELFGHAQLLLNTLGIIAVALLINAASQRQSVLDIPALRWLGRISYSLYLWQQLAFFGLPDAVPLSMRLAFAFAAASASYHFIEKPCDALRRRWLRRRDLAVSAIRA